MIVYKRDAMHDFERLFLILLVAMATTPVARLIESVV